MHEQTAKETNENCSQEVDQTGSWVDRLLTRSENKNGRTQGLFEKIEFLLVDIKNNKKVKISEI